VINLESLDTYSNDIPREKLGTPCIVVLREGDVLYMPRGTVHEAVCSKDHDLHSTHVTISVYQQNHFKTLLTAIFPLALQKSFVQV
jgi:lysine-specific demethylase/histidyl-hydroxylase NO66